MAPLSTKKSTTKSHEEGKQAKKPTPPAVAAPAPTAPSAKPAVGSPLTDEECCWMKRHHVLEAIFMAVLARFRHASFEYNSPVALKDIESSGLRLARLHRQYIVTSPIFTHLPTPSMKRTGGLTISSSSQFYSNFKNILDVSLLNTMKNRGAYQYIIRFTQQPDKEQEKAARNADDAFEAAAPSIQVLLTVVQDIRYTANYLRNQLDYLIQNLITYIGRIEHARTPRFQIQSVLPSYETPHVSHTDTSSFIRIGEVCLHKYKMVCFIKNIITTSSMLGEADIYDDTDIESKPGASVCATPILSHQLVRTDAIVLPIVVAKPQLRQAVIKSITETRKRVREPEKLEEEQEEKTMEMATENKKRDPAKASIKKTQPAKKQRS